MHGLTGNDGTSDKGATELSERHCPHCQTALPDEGLGPGGVAVCPGCKENVQVEDAGERTIRIADEEPRSSGSSPPPGTGVDATEIIAGDTPGRDESPPQAPAAPGETDPEPSLILDSAILDAPGGDRPAGPGASGKPGGKAPAGEGAKRQRSSPGTRPSTGSGTGGRSRESLVDPLVGTGVGGCQILNLLGRGAMGSVYRARQVSLDRIVALKTIREDFCQDEQFLNRFRHEARTVGRFNTPYVVQIHEVGYDEGVHFIVMEFVSGGNLLSLVKEREAKRLTVEEALRFMHETCEGMLEAERLEIVHRDIKPENLLLDQNAHIKIADFGIAKVLGATIQMTASPAILGTPLYMSPEQAKGEDLDHRSDMYSVGATFYHLLTGVPPVRGESVYDLLQRKNEIDYLSPGQILKDETIPDPISRIIEKMTALQPDHRYSSFGEVLEDLERVGAGKEVRARTPPRVRPRKRRTSFVATLIVLALLGGGLWGGYKYLEWKGKEDIINPPRVSTDGVTPARTVTPVNAPFPEAALRAKLEALEKRAASDPSFARLDEFDELRSEIERERDRFDEETRPEAAGPLLSDTDSARTVAIQRAVEAAQARVVEARKDLEGGPDLPLITRLQRERDAIPGGLEAAGELRTTLDELIRAADNAQTLKRGLADLDLEERDDYGPPYTEAIEHWNRVRKTTTPSSMKLCPEILTWLGEESRQRRERLTGKLTSSVNEQVSAARKLLSDVEVDEVPVETVQARIAELERARQNLVNAALTEDSSVWTSRISDELIAELQALVTKRESMVREEARKVQELTTLGQDLVNRYRSVRSLDGWWSVTESSREELDRLRKFAEKNPGQVDQAIDTIGEIGVRWQSHEVLVAKALGHLADRSFRTAAASADREALRRDPLQDDLARAVDQTWTALQGALEALLVDLDLDKAAKLLEDARVSVGTLTAVEGNSSVQSLARQVDEYCASCEDRLAKLRSATQDMAPVPGDEVELPGSGGVTKVGSFFLDRTEVSVDAYRGFLAFLEGKAFEEVKSLWPDVNAFQRYGEAPRYLRQGTVEKAWPIEEVNYYQALAFLRWKNPAKDLPTYAEWWLAARGDVRTARSRPLPIPRADIHMNSARREPVAVDQGGKVLGFSRVTVRHLSGNVAEWSKAEPGEDKTRVLGGNYRPGQKPEYFSGEDAQLLALDERFRGYGFRGVIRVRDMFADLIPAE